MVDFGIIPTAEASVVTLMKSIDRVIINPIIFFLFALAMVFFLYGVAQYLLNPDNEEVRSTSKTHMIWGVIGLFVMIAVFGIMRLILGTVGGNNIKVQPNGDYEIANDAGTVAYGLDSTGKPVYEINQGGLQSENFDSTAKDVSSGYASLDKGGSYTTSPFTQKYYDSPFCWHKEIFTSDVTEYKAAKLMSGVAPDDATGTPGVAGVARTTFLKDTGLTNDQADWRLPMPFGVITLYDKVGKLYYVWWDARAPIKVAGASIGSTGTPIIPPGGDASAAAAGQKYTYTGTISDCKLTPIVNTKLPDPTNQSTKQSSLIGKYTSDASYYRAVDSGVDKVQSTARGIAIFNALIQIAKQKGTTDIQSVAKISTVIEEKYFPQDKVTGDYDYFIALQAPK